MAPFKQAAGSAFYFRGNPEQKMTQMDLLVTNVAELLATAVHEVLRLMGQAVSEYRDESARIRQENQKLQRALEELQKRLQISGLPS